MIFFDSYETKSHFKNIIGDSDVGGIFINGKEEPSFFHDEPSEYFEDDHNNIEDYVQEENTPDEPMVMDASYNALFQVKAELSTPTDDDQYDIKETSEALKEENQKEERRTTKTSRRKSSKVITYNDDDIDSENENNINNDDDIDSENKNNIKDPDYDDSDYQEVEELKKCTQCGRSFSTQLLLDDHVTIDHNGFLSVKCNQCDTRYPRAKEVKKHFKKHHPAEDYKKGITFYCQWCECTTKLKHSLSNHQMYKHSAKEYPCNLCEKKFTFMSDVRKHQKIKHLKREYVCQKCGREYATEGRMKNHIKMSHDETKHSGTCHICGHVSPSDDSLAYHYKQKHESIPAHLPQDITFFKCHKCPHTFRSEKQVKRHVEMIHGSDEETICTKCGITYKGIHRCTHHSHNCSHCSQSFVSRYALVEHELSLHKQEWNHKCEQCGLKFGTYIYLRNHMRTNHKIHLPLKPNELVHNCSICNLTRSSKLSLSFHYKSEHGLLPKGMKDYSTFDCPHCSKMFAKAVSMYKHVSDFHDNPPMFCDRCQVPYRKKHTCRKLSKLPTIHQCPHCDKRCKGPANFQEHVKTKHELVFAFQCVLCGIKKGTRYVLGIHLNHSHSVKRKDQVKDIHFREL